MNGVPPALNENIFQELYKDEVLSFSKQTNPSNILSDCKVPNNSVKTTISNEKSEKGIKILCFVPSLTYLTTPDKKFLSFFKNQRLNLNSLKNICHRYAHKVLKDLVADENNDSVLAAAFNEVGYDLARALSLIYDTPISHHIEKFTDEVMYRIVIKCEGIKSCNFFATFEYEKSLKTLILASNEKQCSNLDCKCKSQFDNTEFWEYTLLNPKINFLRKISIFNNCFLYNTVMAAQSLISVFSIYLKNNSSLIVAANNILQKLPLLFSTAIYPNPIIIPREPQSYDFEILDSETCIDWKQWIAYFSVDCQKNGSDFEIITNDKGDIIGILVFFVNTLSVFKKHQNYNIHLKKLVADHCSNLNMSMVIGELSNNKVHTLSLFLSKGSSQEAYSLLLKSTFMKLKEPHIQLTQEIISNFDNIKTPSRISFFSEHCSKQIEMFDKSGITLKSKNDYLLLSLAKLFNNSELNYKEKQALKIFEFNTESLDYVDDHINYGVIIYHKESSVKSMDLSSSTDINETDEYVFSFSKEFQLLYENKLLIKDIVETKYGKSASYNITECDIKQADRLFKTSRDINEFVLSLCVLMYACHFHKKRYYISKFLAEASFGKDASKLSWMYNGLLAQQNVNLHGELNCKFFKIIKIGKKHIKLNIRDDFGTGSDSSCRKLVTKICSKHNQSQNDVINLIKRLDFINSNRLQEHKPQKFNMQLHDINSYSRRLYTDYNELLISNLKINIVGGLMISYLYYYVKRDVQFYSNAFIYLKDDLLRYLNSTQSAQFKSLKFSNKLATFNPGLTENTGLISKLKKVICNKVKDYKETINDFNVIAEKVACEAFLIFLQSFECGEHFRYNESNIFDVHPITFNYKLLNRSYSKYNCYTTHFECIHKFINRIDIVFLYGRFKIKIVAPYKQDDIPVQYQHHINESENTQYEERYEVMKNKLKRFEQIPTLKPLLETQEAKTSNNSDSSSDSLVDALQTEKYEKQPTNENKKSLLIESDDTITDDVVSVAPPKTLVVAKPDANKEEAPQVPIDSPDDCAKSTPIVKEEQKNDFDFTSEFVFQPIASTNSSYNLNSFKNKMKRRLRNIHCGESYPSSGFQSRHLRKRKNIDTIQPPRRVLRKKTGGTEDISGNIRNKSKSAIEDFFFEIDIY